MSVPTAVRVNTSPIAMGRMPVSGLVNAMSLEALRSSFSSSYGSPRTMSDNMEQKPSRAVGSGSGSIRTCCMRLKFHSDGPPAEVMSLVAKYFLKSSTSMVSSVVCSSLSNAISSAVMGVWGCGSLGCRSCSLSFVSLFSEASGAAVSSSNALLGLPFSKSLLALRNFHPVNVAVGPDWCISSASTSSLGGSSLSSSSLRPGYVFIRFSCCAIMLLRTSPT
jgi:hypothetical protein